MEVSYGRIQSDDRDGHRIAGGIGIEAAMDLGYVGEESREPAWAGLGPEVEM